MDRIILKKAEEIENPNRCIVCGTPTEDPESNYCNDCLKEDEEMRKDSFKKEAVDAEPEKWLNIGIRTDLDYNEICGNTCPFLNASRKYCRLFDRKLLELPEESLAGFRRTEECINSEE